MGPLQLGNDHGLRPRQAYRRGRARIRRTDAVDLLDKRADLAPDLGPPCAPRDPARGQQVKKALPRRRGQTRLERCRQIKIETQNINVPACRFYVRQGCVLGAINRHAYPEFPTEVKLLWYKDLD